MPVYNAESYLTYCVESLVKQTLKECEFIFIDDGSTDESLEILKWFLNTDERIVLFKQPNNEGVSSARNLGIEHANGEYIGFVDADDYVQKDMYEKLYKVAKNANVDIVVSNIEYEVNGKSKVSEMQFPTNKVLENEIIENEILPYFLLKDDLNSVCNKLFKREIIKKNKFRFNTELTLGEDGLFSLECFSQSRSCYFLNYTGYHYREVNGSATRNILKKDYFKNALELYKQEVSMDIYQKCDFVILEKMKTTRFINSVISYIHIYFTPNNDVSFFNRYMYVKSMISNKQVKQALPVYLQYNKEKFNWYDRLILKMIKRNFALGIYGATVYSRFRSR
ncbi:glycosyltransferase family 2 protein [Sutcliffiella horikoshii]|uniref:glycosyltransferase family 2 protein n=1 Tax=Sutcliffiella horikoshii TaxID=79883 RepID=UPI001FD24855|nr:glycosyltransferase family 2 protein [Sutcliffiella horikoshii]